MNKTSFKDIFQFKPLLAAKVSEISEATAASATLAGERINFHIGNPLQDSQLQAQYIKLLLAENHFQYEEAEQKEYLSFLEKAVGSATPYAPRGGYSVRQTNPLISKVQKWLSHSQKDTLKYDAGEHGGLKEMMISSGGVAENLRILFSALNRFLETEPAFVHLHQMTVPEHLFQFKNLHFSHLPPDEDDMVTELKKACTQNIVQPHILLLGTVPTESLRRELRLLAMSFPVFFVELNNASNQQSLAREAQMAMRVLRFLTPKIFNPQLESHSINFVLGPQEWIRILETVHFELKGTPSAPEMELLFKQISSQNTQKFISPIGTPANWEPSYTDLPPVQAQVLRSRLNLVRRLQPKAEKILSRFENRFQAKFIRSENYFSHLMQSVADPFSDWDTSKFVQQLLSTEPDHLFENQLEQSALQVFLNHHPQYKSQETMLVSGSARTALSILGYYCGIREIISLDLSWTYEHCFPKVQCIPLSPELNIHAEGILDAVHLNLKRDPEWATYGAVVLNSPHNASGKVFDEKILKKLLLELFKINIRVIDDLSYQNVIPQETFSSIKTLQQLTDDLHKAGYLTLRQSRNMITVHSLSKTDSLAGARIAFVHIPDLPLRQRFQRINRTIKPNSLSVLITYLFYRNDNDTVQDYWRKRNTIFAKRSQAIQRAIKEIPADRNPFGLRVINPEGSMYPHLVISNLPDSISLDWLSTQLAVEGIGLIPLSTFARTAMGYKIARKAFRLSLGGSADAEKLYRQTRRLCIDLNRLLTIETAKYIRKEEKQQANLDKQPIIPEEWQIVFDQIESKAGQVLVKELKVFPADEAKDFEADFTESFLKPRLMVLKQRLQDELTHFNMLNKLSRADIRSKLIPILQTEFYKESLENRQDKFRKRLFDRTVHPTQMYALAVDTLFQRMLEDWFIGQTLPVSKSRELIRTLAQEYLGANIAIPSTDEGDELVLDLKMFSGLEQFAFWQRGENLPAMISFWGDWDGSTRPSGQGHRLVAAVLLENIRQMALILELVNKHFPQLNIEPELLLQIRRQNLNNQKLWKLFNSITHLTSQLENRYKNIVKLDTKSNWREKITSLLNLGKDHVELQWMHNDRLERRMQSLRQQRRQSLEDTFKLNKELRKALHSLLPILQDNLHGSPLLYALANFRDLLKRFVLTPRIHQKMITSEDVFAIDTTVFNIMEINEIGASYGNPALIQGLQISMSTQHQALIDLDRKLNSRKMEIEKRNPELNLNSVCSIPLFEDSDSVENIGDYLDHIWEYARRSKSLQQMITERFIDIIGELFIAGSDLSQQVSQAVAANLFANAKYATYQWLSKKSLIDKVRIKLGSGEPMQRQGGYYDKRSGQPAFLVNNLTGEILNNALSAADQESTAYARSPLRGILSGGDLRTFQSNLMERLRFISYGERADLFSHISELQKRFQKDLIAAAEPYAETRLDNSMHSDKSLKLLSGAHLDDVYQQFLKILSRNFRTILYGTDEDVLGIHIISYFISRSLPALRDRPAVRPGKESGHKVVGKMAHTLPLSESGTMLRAIGHSKAQTMILGINQLTSGLFLSLNNFFSINDLPADAELLLRNSILPRFPVYDILHTLRIYQDDQLTHFDPFESLFPSWNSATISLRQEQALMKQFIPLFQKELIRRLGLNVNAFFSGDRFKPQLLCTLQPDLAVLLQENLFNTDPSVFISESNAGSN